jgi:hypothetical protein
MKNDRIKEREKIEGEKKERERFLKDKLLLSRIGKRKERDWIKDRRDRRRNTE